MIEPAISTDDVEDLDEEIYAEEIGGSKEEEFDVSVHALAGYANPQTMHVKVKVVDGRSLACSVKCSDVEISMQGQHIRTYIFLLPLEGYDLVLGAW
ncbi:unnamed protein product [Prunus armeniaca]|uniref:Uncharacterized protein n=1 Tax=Prunus armeniaca TaxID=36596 RepID=A0A6J5TLA6_PRUAR|nr:unnamed protein product [Prunus armeniaca]CAB4294371.1 unnamed protein product [Prunus armeniaca]